MNPRNIITVLGAGLLLSSCMGGAGGSSGSSSGGAASSPVVVANNTVEQIQSMPAVEQELPAIYSISAMSRPRRDHTATLLDDGSVFVTGGQSFSAITGRSIYSTSETLTIDSEGRGEWSEDKGFALNMSGARMVALRDGKILIATNASATIYNPSDKTGVAIEEDGCAPKGKSIGKGLLLNDGRVFFISDNSAQIFNSREGKIGCFSAAAQSNLMHDGGDSMVLLNDGRVLVAGAKAGAEIYNPERDEWTTLKSDLAIGRRSTATVVLEDGRVMFSAGQSNSFELLNDAEIFDPATEEFHVVEGKMKYNRAAHAAFVIKSGSYKGQVAIVGGVEDANDNYGTTRVTIFDAQSESFVDLEQTFRYGHKNGAMVQLQDGRMLMIGGYNTGMGITEALDPGRL